jgi:hypothetical protein
MAPWLVCEQCPVAQQCLAYALETEANERPDDRFGLWAFTTPALRWRIAQGYVTDYRRNACGSLRGWQMHKAFGQEPCRACERRWQRFKALEVPPEHRHLLDSTLTLVASGE